VANGLLLANVGGYTSYFFQGAILLGAVWFARAITGKGGI
jgi:ribose/xylose/arabinose/galactoside ABC-type transport system permease subunit